MISSINVQGYRGLERFEMANLGRLNLLVGVNNSGKTSVLEALHLLTSRGDPAALWQLLWRRGERIHGERSQRQPPELDICHLFTGHEMHIGSKFVLAAKNQTPERSVTFSIVEVSSKERELFAPDEDAPIPSRHGLSIRGTPSPPVPMIPLTRAGTIRLDELEAPRRVRRRSGEEGRAQYIATDSLTGDELVALWNRVALTPHESLVLRALQFLDPNIERIAAQVGSPGYYGGSSRGGFIVKLAGHEQPIPIGTMGDGMWRMLAMAIAITQSRGGMLLVDEIDTGLHHTVMADMWKLIFLAAREFDVQVFATTHSYDCVYSLAQICTSETDPDNRITLQRLETGRPKAVPYTEGEIRVAAERQIEVR